MGKYMRCHFQTEFSALNVIVRLRGWGVEAMMLRIIVNINCLILLQNLGKTSSKCDEGGEGV